MLYAENLILIPNTCSKNEVVILEEIWNSPFEFTHRALFVMPEYYETAIFYRFHKNPPMAIF